MARLTRSEVVRMHDLRRQGETTVSIAATTGRHRETVRRALRTDPSAVPVLPLRLVPRVPPVPPPPTSGLPMRRARAEVRRDLTTGRRTLHDVLLDPAVADLALAEVVRLQWTASRRRAVPALEELGRLAVRDRVNLMMAVGRASGYSRAWVAEHGSKWARPRAVAS
jgi:hypothetical protein